jgi:GNAT superfamily N-acetyltransferase
MLASDTVAETVGSASIRHAGPEDAMRVRRFIREIRSAYGVPLDLGGLDADLIDFGSPRKPGGIHLVADVDGTPVGSVILTPCGRDSVKLSKLFVDSPFRGGGLGRWLLNRAVSEAGARGYREIFLTTRARYREAIRLYESEGWIRGPDQKGPGPERLYYLPLSGGPRRHGDHAADQI